MGDTVDPTGGLISDALCGQAPLEAIPAGEAEAIAASVTALEARVRAMAAADGGVAHRDAHPKAHGCVQAELTVLDGLASELRVGLFTEARAYPAWVRFSSGSGTPQKDSVGDGRGMAVKVLGVAGSASGTQDFLTVDGPAFFVRNAVDYVEFNKSTNPMGFFLPGWNPFRARLHELFTALSITWRKVSNPLNAQYFSMTPYLYGDRACKFSWRPVGPASPFTDTGSPNFLRDNLVKGLAANSAAFVLCVQFQKDPKAQPVEDPTVVWSEAATPFIPIARLTIPAQVFDTAERAAFGENLSFTPWHGLDAHRPLGGVNRTRRAVYETISRVRHQINGAVRSEPQPFTLPTTPPAPAAPSPPPPSKEISMGSILDGVIGGLGGLINSWGWADKTASAAEIDISVSQTRTRPHPWSTASTYISWKGLTDRTYQARHLPAPATPAPTSPTPQEIAAKLFARPSDEQDLSSKSTCLFPAFAQYLTDGFIRTVQAHRDRTTTNHEIDLCPLYGRTEVQTNALRLMSDVPGRKGRLKSQMIGTEEFSPYLFQRPAADAPAGAVPALDPQFADLDPPLTLPGQDLMAWDPAKLLTLFAVGGDRVNSSPFAAMLNTLLLREHNWVAEELEQQNPGWDDERVFQTARNIMIPMFIKIVVEQYINHATPTPFNIVTVPDVAWTANWNRPNWITAEFSLLYRWHSLMPDQIVWDGRQIPLSDFTLDNGPLLQTGLLKGFQSAAGQAAGKIGALNTNPSLAGAEIAAIMQMRFNNIDRYNQYRAHFNMPKATTFEQITSNPAVAAVLRELYATPDDVEFYPGLFAEDRVPNSPLPGLLLKMVAVDAFSQALTNPLMSEHVWGDPTHAAFTPWGFDLIGITHSLGDILARQNPGLDTSAITMTQPSWRYGQMP